MERKLIIGVDVSKSTLDYVLAAEHASWSELQQAPVKQIKNEVDSIEFLLSSLEVSPANCLFVLEPTGSYSDKLLEVLSENAYPIVLVNPSQSHHFAEFLGLKNKNDHQAARSLAYMAISTELPLYVAPSKALKERKKLLSALNALQKDQQAMANRIHAQGQHRHPNQSVLESFQAILKSLDQQIAKLEEQLEQIDDPEFEKNKKLAMSVVGIGPVCAKWILLVTENLKNFHHRGQVLKFCGLAPGKHQSGSSIHINRGVSKQSTAKLRAVLFMGARSAIRYNKACKELYERLRAKGKSHYKAMAAVMAKLLKQVFAVVKSRTPFDNDYYLKFKSEN